MFLLSFHLCQVCDSHTGCKCRNWSCNALSSHEFSTCLHRYTHCRKIHIWNCAQPAWHGAFWSRSWDTTGLVFLYFMLVKAKVSAMIFRKWEWRKYKNNNNKKQRHRTQSISRGFSNKTFSETNKENSAVLLILQWFYLCFYLVGVFSCQSSSIPIFLYFVPGLLKRQNIKFLFFSPLKHS